MFQLHQKLYKQTFLSPVGEVRLVARGEHLIGVLWPKDSRRLEWPQRFGAFVETKTDLLEEAQRQLNDYFSGERKVFDLPLVWVGSDFQQKVWQSLTAIPYGETWTYGEQANFLGCPQAARAVGAANGKNPLSMVVPCHRVIGKSGKLTGYAGGLSVKEALLTLERKQSSFRESRDLREWRV
jgi:methylated-DNA-[protein]-cysteine S-methyltransferase